MNSYEQTAADILQIIGPENIISAAHCATRLRLVLKDFDTVDNHQIEDLDLVKGVFVNGGQYQIILGTGVVNKVFGALQKQGIKTLSKEEQKEAVKKDEKGLRKMMTTLADIFVPIIPVIAATGLFLGLKGCLFNESVLAFFGMSGTMIPESVQVLMTVLTDTAFAFLPAIIVWSSFRVFGGTPVIGLVIGLMLVSPSLPNAYSVADPNSGVSAIMAFGWIPIVGCQGSVLTAIAAGYIGSKMEIFFRRIMPDVFDLIMTPFMVMLLTMLIIFLGIGPIMHNIELGMVSIIEKLIHLPFGIGGFLIGFTYPLAVITGLHHSYLMVETSLLANTGYNALITLCAMYGFANVGTCLAFIVRARQSKVRQTAYGAMASQLFGISEPVLFGIQLRYNLKPLIVMCLSSGIGACLLSIFGVQANAYGLAVLPSYLMYIYEGHQLLFYFLISIGTVILCFILTYLFATPQEILEADELAAKVESLSAPDKSTVAEGKRIPLESTADPVFSTKAMGDGYAIIPANGTIRAPFAGTVISVYPGGHCYGIKGDDGTNVLIHIGIDTVTLNGKGFNTKKKQGDHVKAGDILVETDLDFLAQNHLDPTIFVIFPDQAAPQDQEGENLCQNPV